MRFHATCLASALALIVSGCAQRPLPKWEPPLARTEFQTVRTTAYNDGEADHRPYTNHNALGTTLQAGPVNSAAADWGRWPAGTIFRILQTNETYVVDDYGWDLAGTNTIDLYKNSMDGMNRWGVQRVNIQILQWGDARLSYHTLLPRNHYRHVERMLAELRPQLDRSPPTLACAPAPMEAAAIPLEPAPQHVSAATAPAHVTVPLTPFY